MNKEEAAQFLGITVRTLQRHMAAHRIGFEMRRTLTGEEAAFSREELERFKAEREALTTTVSPAVSLSEDVSPVAQQALQQAFPSQDTTSLSDRRSAALEWLQSLATVSRELAPAVELKDKLMLTEREAAAYSGLSLADIERARNQLKSIKTGAGWRVKRESLEVYVRKL